MNELLVRATEVAVIIIDAMALVLIGTALLVHFAFKFLT